MTEPPNPPQTPTGTPSVQIEVCEKHGLRYNAAADDGCARCRTEAGGRTLEQRGFAPRRAHDLKRSLLVTAALVVGIGGTLFAAHSVAYHAGKAVMKQVLEDSFDESVDESEEDYEEAFEELFGDG